jgi:C1A family cysteine protease
MKAIFALLIGVAVSDRLTGYNWRDEIVEDFDGINHVREFEDWAKFYNKKYDSLAEESKAFLQFLDTWKEANDWNKAETHSWSKGLNQFSDLTHEEFQLYVGGETGSCFANKDGKKNYEGLSFIAEVLPGDNNPSSIDWTNYNGKSYVTPVKNQGQCGSCWAFSAVGSTESQYAVKHQVTGSAIPSLSEQQVVDCDKQSGGCNGGIPDTAYNYMKTDGGLCNEQEYPYVGRNGQCKDSSCGTKYDPVTGFKSVTHDNPVSLETAVATTGPVSICLDAGGTFSSYSGGIVDGGCGTAIDHCVLVVGYGTSPQKYWRIKNSWGRSWGVSGYIKLCKQCGQNGNQGECAMLAHPTYPYPK